MGEKYVVSGSKIRISGFFFGFSVMGVGVFSWGYEERERDAWGTRGFCLALGGGKRARKGGRDRVIGCRGLGGREFFFCVLLTLLEGCGGLQCGCETRESYYCGIRKKKKEKKSWVW